MVQRSSSQWVYQSGLPLKKKNFCSGTFSTSFRTTLATAAEMVEIDETAGRAGLAIVGVM